MTNTSEVSRKFQKLLKTAQESPILDEKIGIYRILMEKDVAASYEAAALLAYQNRFWTSQHAPEVEIWLRKGIRKDVPWCSLTLGWMFQEGLGVSKDPEEALRFYLDAAQAGLGEGYFRLGTLLVSGVFGERSPEKAAPYFWEALQRGHEKSKEYLKKMSSWQLVSEDAFGVREDLLALKRFLPSALDKQLSLGDGRVLTKDELIEEANQGGAEALYQLGLFFLDGVHGFGADEYKGANCLASAAERGHGAALYELANLHILGKGVPQDYKKARELLESAASQGNGDAMNRLGDWYAEKEESDRDWSLALFWYQRGVEKHNQQAMLTLGKCYLDGVGIEKNRDRALVLFRMMAKKKSLKGMNWLGKTLLQEPDLHVQEEGLQWLRKSAREGDSEGMYLLYICYSEGWGGISKDEKEALTWLIFSARRGYDLAQKELGLRIARKLYRPPSHEEEFQWLQMAALSGDAPAMSALGLLYLNGNSYVEINGMAGRTFLEKAAHAGWADAQMNLAHLYRQEKEKENHLEIADYWQQEAFRNGSTEAYYLEGLRLWNEGNQDEGIERFTYAADYHFTPAAVQLGDIFKEEGRIDKARFWYEQALDAQDFPKEDIERRLRELG